MRFSSRIAGWQGVALIAISYVYFLIFAQFAFLERLSMRGISGSQLNLVMALMAVGGIAFSLLLPVLSIGQSPAIRLRVGLVIAGGAAFLSLLPLGVNSFAAVAFLIGSSLAVLTVTLATNLRELLGQGIPLFKVGLGTGIGYLFCNFPSLFTASSEIQAALAGTLCFAGAFLPMQIASEKMSPSDETIQPSQSFSFLTVLSSFTALVWLDSAAFFIIQKTPPLKAATWSGSTHLWANGILHLLAALAGAWLLSKRGVQLVLAMAFLALACACLLLLDLHHALLASVFYPVGVSLYSVALVAYPSLLASASHIERGRMAGWIYAVAGWAGSVMGIGMAQNLGYIPVTFVAVAGAVILLPTLCKKLYIIRRELILTASILFASFLLYRLLGIQHTNLQSTQVERGRQVYISEGCIHCHSQYVRPNTPDELLWGPASTIEEIRHEHPPLIGNRRQGPDLSEVGGRRSPLWIKAHFFNPSEVTGTSIMPGYGFLFKDSRGDDLVAYLASLHSANLQPHLDMERRWHPSTVSIAQPNAQQGKLSYQHYCATCHDANGRTRLIWQADFKRAPPDFSTGPFFYLPPYGYSARRLERLAQIAKFGIPGTDMPGHEYLPDNEIASISLWLSQRTAHPFQKP